MSLSAAAPRRPQDVLIFTSKIGGSIIGLFQKGAGRECNQDTLPVVGAGACRRFLNRCGSNFFATPRRGVKRRVRFSVRKLRCGANEVLRQIFHLHAVEMVLVYTRLGDLKTRCGAKDFRCGANSRRERSGA